MKRGGPLARRTPLRGNRPPTRKPMRSGKPGAPKRRRRTPDPDRDLWRRLREQLYLRARGLCERCGRSLDDLGMEAHHRKLRSQGGRHELVNLAALCPRCHHDEVHAHPARAREDGWIVPGPRDPASWPIRLHDNRVVRLTEDGGYDLVFDSNGEPA